MVPYSLSTPENDIGNPETLTVSILMSLVVCPCQISTQGFQKPLTKAYTLNCNKDPCMIQELFFNSGLLEAPVHGLSTVRPARHTRRTAGEIEYCDVLYNDWGQPRGIGFVRFLGLSLKSARDHIKSS